MSKHHDGEGLQAKRDAPLGGQAVLEGVMMRGISTWAVAVRKPPPDVPTPTEREAATDPAAAALLDSGEIEVESFPLVSVLKKHRSLRFPIVRGVVAMVESMQIGFKALGISANAQLPEEEEPISKGMWGGTIVFAMLFGVALFFVLPVGLTSLLKDQLVGELNSGWLFWLVEGIVRTLIFLGYLYLLSKLRDLRRILEYHGAEHKTISCYENQDELTPANAQLYSRLHPRCGTSFLLIVMIVAIFIFAPLGVLDWYWLVLSRIVGIPLIIGISFELIKLAGKYRAKPWVAALIWPGMQLQRLTTQEPDEAQLEVAIAALQAVLEVERPGEMTAEDLVGVEVAA